MEKRNCTNCAFCDRFKYFTNDETVMMRCWHEENVCDHAFVQTIKEGEKYVCENHRFPEEHKDELFQDTLEEFNEMIDRILDIVEAHEIDASANYSAEKIYLNALKKKFGKIEDYKND